MIKHMLHPDKIRINGSLLEKSGFQVDYILTHTGPRQIVAEMGYVELSDEEVELRQFLQQVADNADFTAWYFGHFHEDAVYPDRSAAGYDGQEGGERVTGRVDGLRIYITVFHAE